MLLGLFSCGISGPDSQVNACKRISPRDIHLSTSICCATEVFNIQVCCCRTNVWKRVGSESLYAPQRACFLSDVKRDLNTSEKGV